MAAARTSTAFRTGRVSELDPSRGGAFVLLPRRARGLPHAARRPAPPAAARWEPTWAGEGGLFLEAAAAVHRMVDTPSRDLARWAGRRLRRRRPVAAVPRGPAARREPAWAGEGGLFLDPA